jgi:hypothetical protein
MPKTTKLKGSVWFSLFMNGIGKCNIPYMPLHRLKQKLIFEYENGGILNLETDVFIRRYRGTLNVTRQCNFMKNAVWSQV